MRKSGNLHQQYACIEMQGSVPAASEFTPCPVAAGEYAAQDVSLTTPRRPIACAASAHAIGRDCYPHPNHLQPAYEAYYRQALPPSTASCLPTGELMRWTRTSRGFSSAGRGTLLFSYSAVLEAGKRRFRSCYVGSGSALPRPQTRFLTRRSSRSTLGALCSKGNTCACILSTPWGFLT